MRPALFLAVAFLTPLVVGAADVNVGEQASVAQSTTIPDDTYLAGGSVMHSGTIRGDLAAVGGSVVISGPVSGDVLVGGGSITITGAVGDDVRFGGGTITVQGTVAGDVVGGGGQVALGGSKVGGDVVIGAGSIAIETPVAGDLLLGGGDVYINSAVDGSVRMYAERVRFGPKALIQGTLVYSSPQEAILEAGAQVKGEIRYTPVEQAVPENPASSLGALAGVWVVSKAFMMLLGALAFGYFFSRYSQELVTRVVAKPWAEGARGIVFIIVVPVLVLILLISVIGITLGLMTLFAYIAALIAVSMVAPIIVGGILYKVLFSASAYEVHWKSILLGVVILSILSILPIVGWLLKFLIYAVTLGAMLGIKWDVAQGWR